MSDDRVYRGSHYSKIFDLLVAQTSIAIDTESIHPGKIRDKTSKKRVTDTGRIETNPGERHFWLTLQAPHRFLHIEENHKEQEVYVSWGVILDEYTDLDYDQKSIMFPIGNQWVRGNIPYFYSEWLRIMQKEPWETRKKYFKYLLQASVRQQEKQWALARTHSGDPSMH